MRDPESFTTSRGTPLILLVSRVAFFIYFFYTLLAISYNWFPDSYLNIYWWIYLVLIYVVCEKLYQIFLHRGIDLVFAFPLLLPVFLLNLVSLLTKAQEEIPVINQAEHFTSFVLLAYIVWIFFTKYLPQNVWKKHPYYTSLLVLSVTSLAGTIHEIAELLMDSLFGTQTIGPDFDTNVDLLMNTLGAGLFLSVRLILREAGFIKD